MKKSTKVILIVLIIVIILMLGVVAAGLTLYLKTDLFKSDQQLFLKYASINGEIFRMIEDSNLKEQEDNKKIKSYTSTGEMTAYLQMSETDTVNYLEGLKLNTNLRHDVSNGRTYADAVVNYSNEELFKASYINSGDIYALKSDEIITAYLGVENKELKTLASKLGIADASQIPDKIDPTNYEKLLKITEQEKQHIINTYRNVFNTIITSDNYSSQKNVSANINGATYNDISTYTLSLSEAQVFDLLSKVFETLKQDTVTLNLIANKMSILGIDEYTDITKIQELIDKNMALVPVTSENEAVSIIVYVQNGKTIKTELIANNNEVFSIEYNKNYNVESLTMKSYSLGNTTPTIETNTLEEFNNMFNNTDIYSQSNLNNSLSPISAMQRPIINITKTTTENEIITQIELSPEDGTLNSKLLVSVTSGKLSNGTAENKYACTILNEGQTVEIIYSNILNIVDTVEEIPELDNTNCAILNNYSSEQIYGLMEQISQRIQKVFSDKVQLLGVGE